MMFSRSFLANSATVLVLTVMLPTTAANAQEQLPWGQSERSRVIQPGDQGYGSGSGGYGERAGQRDTYAQRDSSSGYPSSRSNDERDEPPPNRDYRPASPVYPSSPDRSPDRAYGDRSGGDRSGDDRSYDNGRYGDRGPGRPYENAPPPYAGNRDYDRPAPYARGDQSEGRTYSNGEITNAGHRFFGRITSGLANVIEHAFKRGGRPNGYILGEEGGGAFIAGLRYGEGTLHMKDGTRQKVYWQGPSVGYDFGAEGSKTMILVYDLDHPGMIYSTFGGVSGSAYLVGGVGVTFMKSDDVTLAPIRSGIGLRLGANVGYLKYTRAPTWNPF
jgi:hypothetical protein